MREIWEHRPGRIYLLVLLASIIGVLVVIGLGLLEIKIVLFGFVTMPLLVGALFVIVWLVSYLVYFFKFWPYR